MRNGPLSTDNINLRLTMAEEIPDSSQENNVATGTPPTSDNFESSPALPIFRAPDDAKPRKPPTITPRSFTRFFTPKSSIQKGSRVGSSRRILKDITASGNNVRGRFRLQADTGDLGEEITDRLRKKRRLSSSPNNGPDLSSPLKRIQNRSPQILSDAESITASSECDTDEERPRDMSPTRKKRNARPPTPITLSSCLRTLGRDLQRELYGQIKKPSRGWDPSLAQDWQYETTRYYSRPEDRYSCKSVASSSAFTLPFCTVACNTNSLVAVGDEDGGIRLLETKIDEKPEFSVPYLGFRPHTNAVLDLSFSPDDMLLATASGDQTAQIIDMPTQKGIYTMAGHVSSIKAISFQPGSRNVLATSSRDGSVQIWDLRCGGINPPVREVKMPLEPAEAPPSSAQKMTWARPVNMILEAHSLRQSNPTKTTANWDVPLKRETPARNTDVSVTALSFLNPGREHLILTASEANASIRLWDLRANYTSRRGRSTPLSSTRPPDSHGRYRQFGLNSICLSGDAAKLYALCRDNTVYAYSTSQLILGHAPELSSTTNPTKPRRSTPGAEKQGLGPMYGFRHPSFHATTFYVKCAIRPATETHAELLAVGSGDSTPIVFPTDERYMRSSAVQQSRVAAAQHPASTKGTLRPDVAHRTTSRASGGRLKDTIPIYQHGTALISGHRKEVTSLSFAKGGELISVGDDFDVRCWREGDRARELRKCGEAGGKRWGCGWAEAAQGWDDDDSD